MKAKIHPKLHQCKVSCRCGNNFTTRSTLKSLSLAICSECHPYYTGKSKFVDAAGQVDKFVKKFTWNKDRVEQESKKAAAGKSMRKIRAELRQKKEEDLRREQRLKLREEAMQKEREQEDERKRSAAEARKAASKARAKTGTEAALKKVEEERTGSEKSQDSGT